MRKPYVYLGACPFVANLVGPATIQLVVDHAEQGPALHGKLVHARGFWYVNSTAIVGLIGLCRLGWRWRRNSEGQLHINVILQVRTTWSTQQLKH